MCNMASVESGKSVKAAIQTSCSIQFFEIESRLLDKAHYAIVQWQTWQSETATRLSGGGPSGLERTATTGWELGT